MVAILHALKVHWKSLFTIVYPIVLLFLFLKSTAADYRCMYVVLLMAGLWCTEAIPLAVTALFPVVLFPLLGIMDGPKVCLNYFCETNMMFVAGIILAVATEYSGLHIRIALSTLKCIGCSLRRLHLGLILITAFLSLWVSNTAAAAMMMPIIEATLKELETQNLIQIYEPVHENNTEEQNNTEKPEKRPTHITMGFFISTAYAATVGGQGCIIGSGLNLTLLGFLETRFPDYRGISFIEWMIINFPLVVMNVIVLYIFIEFWYMGLGRPNSQDSKTVNVGKEGEEVANNVITEKQSDLGPVKFHEGAVGFVFLLAIILWIFRHPVFMPGWDVITTKKIKDSAPALLACILLFVLPSDLNWTKMFSKDASERPNKPSSAILPWKVAQRKIPWGLLLLLGGGFAIADGSNKSGMSTLVARSLKQYMEYTKFVVMFMCCIFALILTQIISSNVAAANIILPVMAEIAILQNVNPIYIIYPAVTCCSFAYMLPVSTPPNALAAEAIQMPSWEMMKVGFVLAILCFIDTVCILPYFAPFILKLSEGLPDWAKENSTTTTTATTTLAAELISILSTAVSTES